MLDAAYELFCELGYRATTMDAIAERAGVAVQTLYFTFHTKDALLQEVHNHTVLGEDPIPPPQQPWALAAFAEPDAVKSTQILVEGASAIMRRVAPMIPVFHAVAADQAGDVFRNGEKLRREGYHELTGLLAQKRPFRPGMTLERASDVFYVLLSPELYRSFVLELGWTHAEWIAWTSETLVQDLFGPITRH